MRWSAASTRSRRSAGEIAWCSSASATLPATVRQGSRAKSWNTKVKGLRLSGGTAPEIATRPRAGRSRPPMMPSRVDLPQPEGPIRATISPAPSFNPIPSSTDKVPYSCPIPSRISSMEVTSLRHVEMTFDKGKIEDRLGVNIVVDQPLRLIPRDLIIDVAHEEASFGIDVRNSRVDLLRPQTGVFGNNGEDRRRGGTIDRLTVGPLVEEGFIEVTRTLLVGADRRLQHRTPRLDAVHGREDPTQLPRGLVAHPAEQFDGVGSEQRRRRARRHDDGIDLPALDRARHVGKRLQGNEANAGERNVQLVGDQTDAVMKSRSDLSDADGVVSEPTEASEPRSISLIGHQIGIEMIPRLLAALRRDDAERALAGKIV